MFCQLPALFIAASYSLRGNIVLFIMPSALLDTPSTSTVVGGNDIARPRVNKLSYSGSLEKYSYNDLTPVIGREFDGLQVTDLLGADDQLVQDLAVTSE